MSHTFDLNQFHRPGVLRDGTPMVIRVARPDDRARMIAAFCKLDPQTIYTRFFSFKKGLSEAELSHLDAPSFDRYVTLVVTVGDGASETIIAAASCVTIETDGPDRTAELAFTVEEDYQRQGLASQLLKAITDLAHSGGIRHCVADVLPDNAAMLAVFRRSGLPMTIVPRVFRSQPE